MISLGDFTIDSDGLDSLNYFLEDKFDGETVEIVVIREADK